jgi:hypothetical protein
LPPMKREFLVKLNHEFESNLLRHSVSLFLSLGAVAAENSILRPPVATAAQRLNDHRQSMALSHVLCAILSHPFCISVFLYESF